MVCSTNKYDANPISQLLKSIQSLVKQIAFIVGDIRATIAQLEAFEFFTLPSVDVPKPKPFQPQLGKTPDRKSTKSSIKPPSSDASSSTVVDAAAPRPAVQFHPEPRILPCRDYFAQLEQLRNEQIVSMTRLFDSIGPTLVKLESLILGTFTGRSPKMQQYYSFWERELFSLLLKWVSTNLDQFGRALRHDRPLFAVDAVLSAPELMRPTVTEIINTMVHSVKDLLGRLRAFRRWSDGTCVLCEPIGGQPAAGVDHDDDASEPYVFTFFEDVLQVPAVFELMNGLQQMAGRVLAEVADALQPWRRYQSLWLYDKQLVCERHVMRDTSDASSLAQLDEKFRFYAQLVADLRQQQPYQDVRGVRVNLEPLVAACCEHAQQWSDTLGRLLAERTYRRLIEMREHIRRLRGDLDRRIGGLADFRRVMATMAEVQSTRLSVEMRIVEMQETYGMLDEHRVAFEYTDMMMAYHLEKRWRKLYGSSVTRGESLQPLKQKFAVMTGAEIETFAVDVSDGGCFSLSLVLKIHLFLLFWCS